jgi:hypothetical protein
MRTYGLKLTVISQVLTIPPLTCFSLVRCLGAREITSMLTMPVFFHRRRHLCFSGAATPGKRSQEYQIPLGLVYLFQVRV